MYVYLFASRSYFFAFVNVDGMYGVDFSLCKRALFTLDCVASCLFYYVLVSVVLRRCVISV